MDLIWLSHFIPYPPIGGAPQRSFNLLRQASRDYKVHFVCFRRPAVPAKELASREAELKKYCESIEFWDLPYKWKGFMWWAQLAFSPFFDDPYACKIYASQNLGRQWKKILSDYPNALIHIDSSDLGYFAKLALDRNVVLNHHNCESAMAFRRAAVERNPLKKAYLQNQAAKQAKLEREICHIVKANALVSAEDSQLLLEQNSRAHNHVVENGTDVDYFRADFASPEPNSIVFAGSLGWYPNQSGLKFFGEKIWPVLKERSPGIRFYIAGKNPPQWLTSWTQNDDQITLVPGPEDIRPWFARGSVFVCPIIDGGGTRLKLLDAMAMGKAIVSTAVGCEGLGVQHGQHLLVADDPTAFANEVLRILKDDGLRQRLSAAGRRLVEDQFSWNSIGKRLVSAYQCAEGELPVHSPAEEQLAAAKNAL